MYYIYHVCYSYIKTSVLEDHIIYDSTTNLLMVIDG